MYICIYIYSLKFVVNTIYVISSRLIPSVILFFKASTEKRVLIYKFKANFYLFMHQNYWKKTFFIYQKFIEIDMDKFLFLSEIHIRVR